MSVKPDGLISLDDELDTDFKLKPYQQEYCGHYDSNGLRNGQGCQTWLFDHFEKYEGNFLFDNMHGKGTYIIKRGSKRILCSGKFYCNNVEGYAELIYTSGIFEGLFRNNRKFGPGILTYSDGTQDVGLWFDQTLMRLSCVVLPHWVPVFSRTAAAKTFMLQFRKLVPVIPETVKDKATEVLRNLNASEAIIKNAHKLYNSNIRNRNSIFFNKSIYDKVFFDTTDCYIEVAVEESDENEEENVYDADSESNNKSEESLAEDDDSECCCKCADTSGIRRQEILKELAAVNNKLFELLEKIRSNELNNSGSTVDLLSPGTDKVAVLFDSYKAQVEALLDFRENLKSRIAEKDEVELEEPTSTTKVLVTELLAWNNEKMFTKMLQHCFLHKTTEKNMSFDVSKILAGERQAFQKAGKHEKVCVEFLSKCSEGKVYEISDLMRKHNLNPDLCDANGNSGITFAVARDKVLVIKALTNSGANLDAVNDEGLAPLNLCMARYLAVQYGINDWERGFLPELDRAEEEFSETYSIAESHRISFAGEDTVKYIDTTEHSSSAVDVAIRTKSILSKEMFADIEIDEEMLAQAQGSSVTDLTRILKIFSMPAGMQEFQLPYIHRPDREQTYLFNTACVRLMEKPTLKEIQEAGRRKSTCSSKPEEEKEDEEVPVEKRIISEKLEVVRRTMLCLLHYGSDPDVGHVPFPALVMAVFTQSADIVEQLLENNADPNITTLGEDMTALHTVASLQPSKQLIEVGEVLLRYKANPNCRASPTHWLLLNASILGHGFENELPDIGKTPLHLLCMRYDFISDGADYFENLAKLLLTNGANGNDMFLGHSPLSLAVVRGNIRLVQTLLDMGCVDPNQKLGRGMGVPLTVLILKRYADVLYFDVCKVILDTLLEGRANPFEAIFDYGNAIDFMQRKHEARLKAEREEAQKQIEAETVEERKKKSKKDKQKEEKEEVPAKGKRKAKVTDQVLMQNYLLERSREVLFKRIQCQATKLLYEFMDEYIPVNDVIELVRYLTPEDVCNNIELLLREGEMSFEDLHFDTIYRLTHYVANTTKQAAPKKKGSLPPEENPRAEYLQTAQKTLNLLGAMDINERPKFKGAVHPSVDPNEDKYTVCFYCCRKKGRELYKCPKCEMIYFCSELCNKLCNKSKLKHACGLVFYKSQKVLHDQMLKSADVQPTQSKLLPKLNIVQSRKSEREAIKKEERRQERQRKQLFKLRRKVSAEIQRRRQSFICQRKLETYVDIMKRHIEKLENFGEDESSSIMSLTQVAKEITEIALHANLPTSGQNIALNLVRNFSSAVFGVDPTCALKYESKRILSELENEKRRLSTGYAKREARAFQSDQGVLTSESESETDMRRKSVDNRRESVTFSAIPSIQYIKDQHSKRISARKAKKNQMKVIYAPSEEAVEVPTNIQDSTVTSEVTTKSVPSKKKIRKPPDGSTATTSVKVLYKNKTPQKAGETSPAPTVTTDTNTVRGKFWATSMKHESTTKNLLRFQEKATSARKKFAKFVSSTKPSEYKRGVSRESELKSGQIPRETPLQETTGRKTRHKEEANSERFAHYWFHQPFMKRIAKIFPTLNIPKLLLPFACFAEGQLYYRFGKRGSDVYSNYSKL